MLQPESTVSSAQQRFDQMYITGAEIRNRLNVAACTLTMRMKKGTLPEPIKVGTSMYIWERTTIEPALLEWESSSRKAEATA